VKFNPKKEIIVEFTLGKKKFQKFLNFFFKKWRNLAREKTLDQNSSNFFPICTKNNFQDFFLVATM